MVRKSLTIHASFASLNSRIFVSYPGNRRTRATNLRPHASTELTGWYILFGSHCTTLAHQVVARLTLTWREKVASLASSTCENGPAQHRPQAFNAFLLIRFFTLFSFVFSFTFPYIFKYPKYIYYKNQFPQSIWKMLIKHLKNVKCM